MTRNPSLERPTLDADDTVFFLRQLESIDQRPYEVLFSGMLARQYIPPQDGVDPTSNTYTYRMYERTGRAKISGPGANDLPRVGVRGAERSKTVKQIPAEYGWLIREIQQAAKAGVPLDMMTVSAARRAIDFEIDELLAFGDSDIPGMEGLYNITGVTGSTAGTKTTGGKDWKANTPPAEILADMNLIIKDIRTRLKQAGDKSVMFPKFRMLLSSNDYSIAATTPRSTTSDTTILKYFLENNPWIENVYEWWKGDEAGGSVTPRVVAYPPDPAAVAAIVPVDFQSLAPQAEGLGYVIPCFGSCGGVVCRYVVAVGYMDTH